MVSSDHVRLQLDDFVLEFWRKYGWSLHRKGSSSLYFMTWEEAWLAMTTGERVRCAVFAGQLR